MMIATQGVRLLIQLNRRNCRLSAAVAVGGKPCKATASLEYWQGQINVEQGPNHTF